jgi:hypothetical protein
MRHHALTVRTPNGQAIALLSFSCAVVRRYALQRAFASRRFRKRLCTIQLHHLSR